MSIIAEFSIPHEEFALAETFREMPGLVLEAERAVAQPPGRTVSSLCAVGTATDVEYQLRVDPTTTRVSRCTATESGTLYEIEWITAVDRRIDTVLDADVTVLTLVGRGTGWTLRIRVTEHETLSAFKARLHENGCSMTLERLQAPGTSTVDGQSLLTDKQREALVAAQRTGYYDIPRQITLSGLADQLGISQQALSKRLRRAQMTITRRALATGSKEQTAAIEQ